MPLWLPKSRAKLCQMPPLLGYEIPPITVFSPALVFTFAALPLKTRKFDLKNRLECAPMNTSEISEALAPFLGSDVELSQDQIRSIQMYLDLLLKWNSRINLTAIRGPKEILTRHFGESFFAARHLPVSSGETAIDIGSGAGFPGLPLKLWYNGLKLSLIESNQRKATFLREAVRALRLANVDVLTSRAEDLRVKTDLVTLRAVETFDRILPVTRNLTKPGGCIALLIGSAQAATAKSVLPDVDWESALPMPCSQSRILLIGRA